MHRPCCRNSDEIIPESHRRGHDMPATMGPMVGFVTTMLLDTALI